MMYKISVILSLWLLLLCHSVEARTYLVAVGINDYSGFPSKGMSNLRLPVNDANTITWLYKRNSSAETILLTDKDATRVAVLNALNSTLNKASINDIVVFFFSGHGFPGGFCLYDKILSYKEIRLAMGKSKCKNKMIFADSCHSGGLRSNNTNNQNEINASRNANIMLFLSSRNNEYSLENASMQNGFFTSYLQRGLRGNADANRDRIITARELFNFVHSGVVKISKGKQHPVMWGRFDNNMPVMIW